MSYQLPAQVGTNFTIGPDQLFIYLTGQVPMFFPAMLFAFFIIVWFSGMQMQKKQEGRESMSQWFMIAGFLTATLSMLLYLVPGFVDGITVSIAIGVACLGALWFFNRRD